MAGFLIKKVVICKKLREKCSNYIKKLRENGWECKRKKKKILF